MSIEIDRNTPRKLLELKYPNFVSCDIFVEHGAALVRGHDLLKRGWSEEMLQHHLTPFQHPYWQRKDFYKIEDVLDAENISAISTDVVYNRIADLYNERKRERAIEAERIGAMQRAKYVAEILERARYAKHGFRELIFDDDRAVVWTAVLIRRRWTRAMIKTHLSSVSRTDAANMLHGRTRDLYLVDDVLANETVPAIAAKLARHTL